MKKHLKTLSLKNLFTFMLKMSIIHTCSMEQKVVDLWYVVTRSHLLEDFLINLLHS